MNNYIPYGKHYISNDDIDAVITALKSEYITQGKFVPLFERAIAEKVDSSFAVAVNSATSALHISCLALGLKQGDIAWTSPNTFVASANCAKYCGADIDFVDIDPSNGLMCPNELEKKLQKANKENRLPKILIVVHLCGTSCEMDKIYKLSKKYNFLIIEDASHAIGASFDSQSIGNCRYSSITVFSFHPVKIITTGEGGVATTNDKRLAMRMASFRSHGVTKAQSLLQKNTTAPWYYEQQSLGFNYRLTDIQAALGISQLKRLDAILSERNRLFTNYQNLLLDLPVDLLQSPKRSKSSFHLAIIRLRNRSSSFHQMVFEYLRTKGIGVQLHYLPVHLHPYYRKLGFKEGDFPEAERYATNAISLPIYPGLKDAEQMKVIDVLTKGIDRYK